jgi:cyanophycin synthetase
VITLMTESEATPLIYAGEIPATLDGRIRCNIENAMAAIAAAIGADVPVACIRDALRAFSSDFAETPGRFNLIEIGGRQVIMDYCHNVPGLERIAEVVQRIEASRRIGVITMPGDRATADIEAFGRLAATTFDTLVIREDDDARSRKRGEIADLLASTVQAGGLLADRVQIVLDEVAAARTAVEIANPGDLVVVLVDKPRQVWAELQRLQTAAARQVRLDTMPPVVPDLPDLSTLSPAPAIATLPPPVSATATVSRLQRP